MNQAELGRRLGASGTTVGNWENERSIPPSDVFMWLCRELVARPEYLMFGEMPIEPLPSNALRLLPILNTSSAPVVLERLRDLERSEVSSSLLSILGCTDHSQAGWFIVEHDGHRVEWKSGDALLVDQRRKGWTKDQWYLVSPLDRAMEVGKAIELGGSVLTVSLADNDGTLSTSPIDRTILYLGHILCGFRITAPTNPSYDFNPIINPTRLGGIP